jgi:hypothetical protein
MSLFRNLTQEVNNTRLSLVINSAIVEPYLDVSSQVPDLAFISKSLLVVFNPDLHFLLGSRIA